MRWWCSTSKISAILGISPVYKLAWNWLKPFLNLIVMETFGYIVPFVIYVHTRRNDAIAFVNIIMEVGDARKTCPFPKNTYTTTYLRSQNYVIFLILQFFLFYFLVFCVKFSLSISIRCNFENRNSWNIFLGSELKMTSLGVKDFDNLCIDDQMVTRVRVLGPTSVPLGGF